MDLAEGLDCHGHPIQSESAKEKTENVSCNFEYWVGVFFLAGWFGG